MPVSTVSVEGGGGTGIGIGGGTCQEGYELRDNICIPISSLSLEDISIEEEIKLKTLSYWDKIKNWFKSLYSFFIPEQQQLIITTDEEGNIVTATDEEGNIYKINYEENKERKIEYSKVLWILLVLIVSLVVIKTGLGTLMYSQFLKLGKIGIIIFFGIISYLIYLFIIYLLK